MVLFDRNNWFLEFNEEWTEWFRPGMNWRNFTLIQVYYEDECHLGNRELLLRLLGFGVRIVHIYDREAEGRVKIHEAMAEAMAEIEARPPVGKSDG